jgi:hypothetical protein
MTRHHQGFTRIRPSGLPLRLRLLDGTGTLGLDHLGSARRSYPHRNARLGTGPQTLARIYTFDISRTPKR